MYSKKIYKVLRLITKVFTAKFGGVALLAAQVNNPQKFPQRKQYFPPIRGSFLPRKFSLYGNMHIIAHLYNILLH